jgi:hypothetical protein
VATELSGATAQQCADGRVLLAAQGLAQDGIQMITEQVRDLQRRLIARPARWAGRRGHEGEWSAEAATARSPE